MGDVTGEYQFMRRVGEDERPLSLLDEVDWEGAEWNEVALPNREEDKIIFTAKKDTSYKLLDVADGLGVSVPVFLSRTLDLGLRMSYELRHRDDIAYYLKTKKDSIRIDESRLGDIPSDFSS